MNRNEFARNLAAGAYDLILLDVLCDLSRRSFSEGGPPEPGVRICRNHDIAVSRRDAPAVSSPNTSSTGIKARSTRSCTAWRSADCSPANGHAPNPLANLALALHKLGRTHEADRVVIPK